MSHVSSRCFIYRGPGQVERGRIDIECGDDDILLRVDLCGRCGTDKRLFEKAHPLVSTPTVLWP